MGRAVKVCVSLLPPAWSLKKARVKKISSPGDEAVKRRGSSDVAMAHVQVRSCSRNDEIFERASSL